MLMVPLKSSSPASNVSHWPERLSLRQRLVAVLLVELVYWVATRLLLHFFRWDSVEVELARGALRAASAAMDWWLCRALIGSKTPAAAAWRQPTVLLACLLFLLAAATAQHPSFSATFAFVFGLGSIVVGLKEEFLFRGILQNVLQQRWGAPRAVLVTTAAFTVWHWGAVAPSAWAFTQIALAGAVLGILYIRIGSIWAVVVLHTLYDALFALPASFVNAQGNGYAFMALLGALALLTIL